MTPQREQMADLWAALMAYVATPELDYHRLNANERGLQDEKDRAGVTEALARLMAKLTGIDPEQPTLRPNYQLRLGWMNEQLVYESDMVPAWLVYSQLAHELVGALWGAKRAHDERLGDHKVSS